MKRFLLLTALVSVLVSCSAKKQIEQAISHGNYDLAISNALKKLENNKDKARKQDYVVMLKEAYDKVLADDFERIAHLKKDGNPAQYRHIYERYVDLNTRQNAIKRFLPLQVNGKSLSFEFRDYSSELVDYRYKTSDYLIDEGIALLDAEDKSYAREAHAIFTYIEEINPDFEETRSLIAEAHEKGMDYIHVNVTNKTQQIIPEQLEAQLLELNTYGLNQFWVTYHAEIQENIVYDHNIELQIKDIAISPERINERQLLRQRAVVDGWEYELDANGNVAKDSLGNDIKIDKVIHVKARFFEVIQTKSAQVIANVVHTDLKTNEVIAAFPMDSTFIFENVFGSYRGDRRALNNTDLDLISFQLLPFPSNMDMVLNMSDDLKHKFRAILNSIPING